MDNQGQISVEYMIIIGVVIAFIVVPSAIFLSSFVRTSLYGAVGDEAAAELGEGLVHGADQVYYLGLYAKKRVVLPVPDNTEKFYILTIDDGSEVFYYVGVRTNNGADVESYFYQSDAPLTSDILLPSVQSANFASDIPECSNPGTSCTFTAFTSNLLQPGDKEFELETVMNGGVVQVEITPVIP